MQSKQIKPPLNKTTLGEIPSKKTFLDPYSYIKEKTEEEEKEFVYSDSYLQDNTQQTELVSNPFLHVAMPPETNQKNSSMRRRSMRNSTKKQQIQKKTKPVVVLMPPENGDRPWSGSLFDMFQAEMFNLSLFMIYYNKKYVEEGIHRFLTNKLFNYPLSEVEFYIPQLCFLLIKRPSAPLQKFLYDKCAQSIPAFFLISWCFEAFSEQDKQDKKKQDRVVKIQKGLELSMANGVQDLSEQSAQSVQQYFSDKTNKTKYQQSVRLFIRNLIEISLTLKLKKPEDRKQSLKDYILKANKAIEKYRDRNKDVQIIQNILFERYHFAMALRSHLHQIQSGEDSDDDENNNWKSNCIVKIIQDECTCFNTKKRVPYRIVVETIDLAELQVLQPKQPKMTYLVKTSKSDLSLDENAPNIIEDFLGSHTKEFKEDQHEKLEKQMEEISKMKHQHNWEKLKKFQETTDQNELIERQGARRKSGFFFQTVLQIQQQNRERKLQDLQIPQNDLFVGGQQVLTMKQKVEKIMATKKIFKNQIESDYFDQLMKRFEIMFPTKNIERSLSSVNIRNDKKGRQERKKLEKQFDFNRKNNYRFKHLKITDLTTLKRIHFFKSLITNYPEYKIKIEDIYQYLQLDIFESKFNLQKTSNMSEEEIEFPRRFGPWDELWEDKAQIIRRNSAYEHFQSYRLRPIIVKGGDDLRQEIIAMQIMKLMKDVWLSQKLDLWVRTYEIVVTSANSGFLEFCTDTLSIDGLKKKLSQFKSLDDIFFYVFQKDLEQARQNFLQSLAAYSIICYLLQIKDRHNGNILMDAYGHIIHIDFGFMLVTSPGGINFESAPFKLTQEYVNILGGRNSQYFIQFKELIFKGLQALRRNVDDIVNIIEIMMQESDLPCFEKFDVQIFRDRFYQTATDRELNDYVNRLIDYSFNNWKTIQYDNFQKMTNGIMP